MGRGSVYKRPTTAKRFNTVLYIKPALLVRSKVAIYGLQNTNMRTGLRVDRHLTSWDPAQGATIDCTSVCAHTVRHNDQEIQRGVISYCGKSAEPTKGGAGPGKFLVCAICMLTPFCRRTTKYSTIIDHVEGKNFRCGAPHVSHGP